MTTDETTDQTTAPAKTRRKRVLFVDDYADTLMLMALYLGEEPYRVDLADSGQEALRLYYLAKTEGDPYDLLIVDIMMSPVDGRQVVKEIRDSGDSTTDAVYLTAHHSSSYDDGVERWRKPYAFESKYSLRRRIRERLGLPLN